MYEISKFTNLKLKMKYLIKKQTIYDVIFNPYQHLDPST